MVDFDSWLHVEIRNKQRAPAKPGVDYNLNVISRPHFYNFLVAKYFLRRIYKKKKNREIKSYKNRHVISQLFANHWTTWRQHYHFFELPKGRTALHVATEAHDSMGRNGRTVSIGTVRLLLENGADPGMRESRCGDSALHLAVSLSCDPALVKVRVLLWLMLFS